MRNTGNILPNPDAIQEFKVQTNSYNAEYGRFSSGIINVITKAGTNSYKGSAFEYMRDEQVNAKEWGSQLDDAAVQAQPVRRHARRARSCTNQTFFFASYSGLRQDDEHVPEHRHRADRPRADGRLQRLAHAARPTRPPASPSPATASSA